jgi:hypothetical protein
VSLPHPTPVSRPHPTRVSPPHPARARSAPVDAEPLELPTAVVAGLQALGDLRDLPMGVRDGRLERMLRATLDHHRPPRASSATEASAAAVRTACAHLAAGEHEDAYLALCTAYDYLPRRPAPPFG